MVIETNTNSHRGTLFYSFEVPKDGNLLGQFKRYYGYWNHFQLFNHVIFVEFFFCGSKASCDWLIFKYIRICFFLSKCVKLTKDVEGDNNRIYLFCISFAARSQDGIIHSGLVAIYQEKQMKSWIWSKVSCGLSLTFDLIFFLLLPQQSFSFLSKVKVKCQLKRTKKNNRWQDQLNQKVRWNPSWYSIKWHVVVI